MPASHRQTGCTLTYFRDVSFVRELSRPLTVRTGPPLYAGPPFPYRVATLVLECIRLVLTFPGIAAPAHRGGLQALLHAFRPKEEEEEGEQQESDADGESKEHEREF